MRFVARLYVNRVGLIWLVIMLAACAGSVNPDAVRSYDHIDTYVEELVRLNEVPGMAIAAMQNGEVVFEKYVGVTSLDVAQPVTKDTVFRLYSTSKLMTAVAVFQLVEEQKLDLDLPISRFFDTLPHDWADVTVGHLLAHASGLPDVRSLVDQLSDETLSDKDFFKLIFPLERQFSTGADWSYNQTNYLLLKRIIEHVTAQPFEHYLRTQGFPAIPVGRKIFSSNDFESIPNRASNYRYNKMTGTHERKLENWGKRNNVLAGLNLTLKELVDWSQLFDKGQFMSFETRSAMWTPFPFRNSSQNFLYGWGVYPVADQVSYGFTGGGVTGLRKFPDHDLTIVVLTNGFKYYSVHNTVINHVAGLLVPELENKPVAMARNYQHAFLKDGTLNVKDTYDRTEESVLADSAEEVMTSFAYKLLDIDEPQIAIEVFDEIVLRNPDSFAALEALGHARLGQEQPEHALVAFEAAYALQPGNVDLGRLLSQIKQKLQQ